MKAIIEHAGLPVILDRANIDTDQIIPKEHLKSIKRTGFGEGLFSEWRYHKDGSDNPDFPLNHIDAQGASVLIVGNNFGCGSSREHAVWALVQYGIDVVIAPKIVKNGAEIPGFADIFRNNSSKNGLLLIELDEATWTELKEAVEATSKQLVEIDLKSQRIDFPGFTCEFEISPSIKNRLMKGLDDIGVTLEHEEAIETYEGTHPKAII